MKPRSSRINVARKRRPDGSVLEYFYDRVSGAFLGHDRAGAEARLARDDPATGLPPGSFGALVVGYLASQPYAKLAPRTRKLYRGYLDAMRRDYGDLPVRGIRVSTIEAIKERHAAQPRKGNQIIALFRILLKIAEAQKLIDRNPAERPGRLATAPRFEVWTLAEEEAFLEAAGTSLRLAFALLLYTVQRPSDVLAMTLGHVREREGRLFIRLRQQKTDTLIDVPVHSRLAPLLRERMAAGAPPPNRRYAAPPIETTLLVPSPTGKPWAYRNFARAWDAARERAEVGGRQRRDLRRTGIVRLAEAGATTPQIAAVSGHGIDYCQRIIDTYLPRRTEVALGGIEAWEKAPEAGRGNVVQIAPRRKK